VDRLFPVYFLFTGRPVGLCSSRTIKRKRCQREILAGCSNTERGKIAFGKGLLLTVRWFSVSLSNWCTVVSSLFSISTNPETLEKLLLLRPSQKTGWLQVGDGRFTFLPSVFSTFWPEYFYDLFFHFPNEFCRRCLAATNWSTNPANISTSILGSARVYSPALAANGMGGAKC